MGIHVFFFLQKVSKNNTRETHDKQQVNAARVVYIPVQKFFAGARVKLINFRYPLAFRREG